MLALAVRRSHAGALLGLGALLLLLLARLPAPVAPRAPRPAPRAAPSSTGTPAAITTHRDTPAPPSQPAPPAPPAPPARPAAAPHDPGAVYVRDVWVAGHARPHPELCPALGARLRLLILVTSAPAHASARDAVRLTWGHYRARADVSLAFVVGAPPAALEPALDAEDDLYGDLIRTRSLDSYSNLTLKTLSMLEWADTYCPRAQKLLKTDDDMFINVPKLLKFASDPVRVNATRTIWGRVVRKSLPKRTAKSKYFVSPAQFPGAVFPDFATGPAYLVSGDSVRPLLAAAGEERYLRLEDVFVTGVLAQRLGIARRHTPEFYNRKVAAHPCTIQRGFSIHMVRYHEQFDFWRKLLDGKSKCSAAKG